MASTPLKQVLCACTLVPALLLLCGCSGLKFADLSKPSMPEESYTVVSAEQPVVTSEASEIQDQVVVEQKTEIVAPVTRALPELKVPQVNFDELPAAAPAQIDPVAAVDLWQRLRDGFKLSNLEDSPGRVEKFEKWYAKHPKYFSRLAERAYWFLPYVLDQVEARGMPTEVALLPAIESAYRPDATSRSKAAGMWQFIGSTGRRFGLRQDWWMDARRDVGQSTRAALDYLEYLAGEFDGDWEHALAAYNAGEGNIGRQIKKNRANNKPTGYVHLKLRRETSEYVPRLLAVRNILMNPAKYNIELQAMENKPTLAFVDLKTQTDISVAASFLSLNRKQLHFLNLGYKRGVTPPNGPHILVVPIDEVDKLKAKLANLSPSERMQWAHHRVKSGENLGIIARLHQVSVHSIMLTNSLNSHKIQPGQELRIPLSTGAYQYAGPAIAEESKQTRKHMVAAGDSLWKISRRYKVSLGNLLNWNQLSRFTTLHPGQSIIVRP